MYVERARFELENNNLLINQIRKNKKKLIF